MKLRREFYTRPAIFVAPELLGKILVHKVGNSVLSGRIVEAEAYMGPTDKAAHSYNNRRTPRNEVMYSEGGHAYVYFIYGMHYCFNVICSTKDSPQGVLIRAIEPIEGIEEMCHNRFKEPLSKLTKAQYKSLTNGPGKLCSALQITRDKNGLDLCGEEIYLLEGALCQGESIKSSARINIAYAEEAIHYPWRFYIKDNLWVSKARNKVD